MITGKTRRDLTEKARHVPELVESLIEQPALSPRSARRVTEILDRVESELTALRVQSTVHEADLAATPDVARHYFPVQGTPDARLRRPSKPRPRRGGRICGRAAAAIARRPCGRSAHCGTGTRSSDTWG